MTWKGEQIHKSIREIEIITVSADIWIRQDQLEALHKLRTWEEWEEVSETFDDKRGGTQI
jgi:hypothetical protein